MEVSRRTWNAAVKLAVMISIAAVLLVVAIDPSDSLAQAAVVLPVIVVAFTASWIQTGRVQRHAAVPVRHHHA